MGVPKHHKESFAKKRVKHSLHFTNKSTKTKPTKKNENLILALVLLWARNHQPTHHVMPGSGQKRDKTKSMQKMAGKEFVFPQRFDP
jgi:hypothetical protein